MSDLSVEGATSALLEDAWIRRLKAEPIQATEIYGSLNHLYNQLLELREKGGRELRNAILKANPDTDFPSSCRTSRPPKHRWPKCV